MMTIMSREDSVFVLNDLNLRIPPTNISLRQEDLTYQWKTLRTSISTKVASGHGQTAIHLTIPFLDSQVLELHRLIVELKQSPFCYVDNRWLRENICPDWPGNQSMAFTLSSLSVGPMKGSSNVWQLELDLQWFNYFPFTPNFLFREDWNTNWVKMNPKDWWSVQDSNVEGLEDFSFKYSIGWTFDPITRARTHTPSIVDKSPTKGVPSWSVVREDYAGSEHRTIQDMELMHDGQIFDLLPMPGNMEVSRFVLRPEVSRIYVRYVNLVQADALLENFGIDVRADLAAYAKMTNDPSIWDRFFSVWNDDGVIRTVGLHTGWVPRTLQEKWIGMMLKHHSKIMFAYDLYKEIRFPVEWTNKLNKQAQTVIQELVDTNKIHIPGTTETITIERNGEVVHQEPVRRGWRNPEGKHIPIGDSIQDYLETVTSRVSDRTDDIPRIYAKDPDYAAKKAKGYSFGLSYPTKRGFSTMHYGTDSGTRKLYKPVYAVMDGRVVSVSKGREFKESDWRYINIREGIKHNIERNTTRWNDWAYTLKFRGIIPEQTVDGKSRLLTPSGIYGGVFTKSISNPDIYYFQDLGAGGNNLTLSHIEEGDATSYSKYMHLSEIKVNKGDDVKVGQIIAVSGASALFDPAYLKQLFEMVSGGDDDGLVQLEENVWQITSRPPDVPDGIDAYALGPHLHFEFWEATNIGGDARTNGVDTTSDSATPGLFANSTPPSIESEAKQICVDPYPSFEAASDKTAKTIHLVREEQEYIEAIQENVQAKVDDGTISIEEAEAFVELIAALTGDGWRTYDRQTNVQNLWQKTFFHTITRGEGDILEQNRLSAKAAGDPIMGSFLHDDIVLTNVVGQLQHVVANIPILGYEYPTHQHLGSIEPKYILEFACLDDSGALDGIGKNASLIQAMRAKLQSNARKFRPVLDSHTLMVDTFITRLLGTTREPDYQTPMPSLDIEEMLKKRSLISRSSSSTVPGHPGLSTIVMELEETNPYEETKVQSTSTVLGDMEMNYERILKALLDFNAVQNLDSSYLPILLAQLAGNDTSALQGSFPVNYYASRGYNGNVTFGYVGVVAGELKTIDAAFAQMDPNAKEAIILKDDSGAVASMLRKMGVQYETFTNYVNDGPVAQTTYLAIDPGIVQGLQRNDYSDQERLAYIAGAVDVSSVGDYKIEDQLFGLNGDAFLSGARTGYNLAEMTGEYANGMLASEFDVSQYLKDNSDKSQADLVKALQYQGYLNDILSTARRLIAEYEKGGYSDQYVSEQLYNLPITGQMWQCFQAAFKRLTDTIPLGAPPSSATEPYDLTRIPNYFESGKPLPSEFNAQMARSAWAIGWGVGANMVGEPFDLIFDYVYAIGEAAVAGHVTLKELHRRKMDEIRYVFIDGYIAGFPLAVISTELVTSVAEPFKAIIGDWTSPESGGLEAAFYMRQQFKQYLDSTNILFMNNMGIPYIEPPGVGPRMLDGAIVQEIKTNHVKATGWDWLNEAMAWSGETTQRVQDFYENTRSFFDSSYVDTIEERKAIMDAISKELREGVSLGVIGGPAVYPTERGYEDPKIRYIKQLLASLAQEIFATPSVLEAIGLKDMIGLDVGGKIIGSPAYPDLVLPFHPYYGSLYHVSPDFYMWSMYEDGGSVAQQFQEDVAAQARIIVQNCYNSIKKFQGKYSYHPKNEPVTVEPDADYMNPVDIRMSAEGSDAVLNNVPFQNNSFSLGPMGTPFAMPEGAKVAEENFYKQWDKSFKSANDSSGGEIFSISGDRVGSVNVKPPKSTGLVEGIFGSQSYNVRLGTTDGSMQYPMRASQAHYAQLWSNINSAENMFGSKAGFLGDLMDDTKTEGLTEGLKGTPVELLDEYTHLFDPKSLMKLANESSRDIVSQKMTMRRAYPTFKLFFIEEDEMEDRFFSYDDFHTYNAVKSFTVVEDKKLAAATAVITLQNVSGSLDGTARSTITDADYFLKTRTAKISEAIPDAGVMAGDEIVEGTNMEQPFGAIVMRPGMDVQLCAGYSNDPNALEVLISGKVVDLVWNQTGDLVEITVQSFGAELEQAVKGSAANNDSHGVFYTTHQLLSTMMLEPELQHFGRWEFGQLYQHGESKDGRLDFVDYSREGVLGRFRTTDRVTRWMANHPGTMFLFALGATALQFAPIGRVGGPILKRALRFSGIYNGGNRIVGNAAVRSAIKGGLSEVDRGIIVSERVVMQRAAVKRTLTDAFKNNLDELKQVSPKAFDEITEGQLKTVLEAVDKVEDFSDEGVEALVKQWNSLDRHIAGRSWAGRWLGVATFKPFDTGWYKENGLYVGLNLFTTFFSKTTSVAAVTAIATLSMDILREKLKIPMWENFKKSAQKTFSRAKVSMMLHPQDDNLYPPHPKDYMLLERPSWWAEFSKMVILSGSRILTNTDDLGNMALVLWNPTLLIEKRVEPQQVQYNIVASTIWDIFYEMTLRHPGWIFSPRPYGRSFRYTMFFGVPSQRYWSRPAPNKFVHRMNKLRSLLANGTVDETEYRGLYGDKLPDGRTISEYRNSTYHPPVDINPSPDYERNLEMMFASRVMEEYLRGLELRFVPFRRYHMFSSSRDLVWNGITSSESRVVNAVDVAFFDHDANNEYSIPQGTELIKAHSTLSEGMLKIRPILYPNCKGYTMAMRYGMGELIHSMKEMYRGEIIILGNPRVRPWDVGILVDSYNDMVGPIEVEQVVHNFSHETGFITEIKPGAIVIGNEISSWPMIEAMKLWSMAVQDSEANMAGIGGDPGGIDDMAKFISQFGGADVDSHLTKKYKDQRYFPNGADIPRDAFNGRLPDPNPDINVPIVDAARTTYEGWDLDPTLSVNPPTAFLGQLGTFTRDLSLPVSVMLKTVSFGAYLPARGVLALAGYADPFVPAVKDIMQFPSMAWLLGGTILMARCLREDAVIVVPIMKGGHPIVAGLSYQDPSMIWSNFRGEVNNYINDAVTGLRDIVMEYQNLGSAMWRVASQEGFGTENSPMTGEL